MTQLYHKEKDNAERTKWIHEEKVLLEKEKELLEEKQEISKLEVSEQHLWDQEYENLMIKFHEFWKPLTSLIYQDSGDSKKEIYDNFGSFQEYKYAP